MQAQVCQKLAVSGIYRAVSPKCNFRTSDGGINWMNHSITEAYKSSADGFFVS